ncbi:hypothetical protein VZT92_012148 [Zoarces viviparus]|uniref:Uncharacterized protein n=1 Tax=Zoarces viviparus TaxID=48416 RepID=A0AAW1F7T0_ZOAVI
MPTHKRASQRAACQESERGRECRERARTVLELGHSHSVSLCAKEQSRKQAWTNLLDLACCSLPDSRPEHSWLDRW